MNNKKISSWNLPITVSIILIVCIFIGISAARWLNVNLADFLHTEPEQTILSLADYQSSQPTSTPFLPIGIQSTPVPTQETPSGTAAVTSPTSTPQPTVAKIPASHYISGLYGMDQMTTLDCEMRSAVDWARYFGITINETEFISRLPFSDDPETGFVGEIDGEMGQFPPDGYGVYPPPIAALLQQYGLNAQAVKGMTYEDLQREIANDRPVIVWIVNLPFEIDATTYTASNGNTVPVARFEHTWIITGYNLSTVTVVDSSWTYNVILETFLERWDVLGNRAVIFTE